MFIPSTSMNFRFCKTSHSIPWAETSWFNPLENNPMKNSVNGFFTIDYKLILGDSLKRSFILFMKIHWNTPLKFQWYIYISKLWTENFIYMKNFNVLPIVNWQLNLVNCQLMSIVTLLTEVSFIWIFPWKTPPHWSAAHRTVLASFACGVKGLTGVGKSWHMLENVGKSMRFTINAAV